MMDRLLFFALLLSVSYASPASGPCRTEPCPQLYCTDNLNNNVSCGKDDWCLLRFVNGTVTPLGCYSQSRNSTADVKEQFMCNFTFNCNDPKHLKDLKSESKEENKEVLDFLAYLVKHQINANVKFGDINFNMIQNNNTPKNENTVNNYVQRAPETTTLTPQTPREPASQQQGSQEPNRAHVILPAFTLVTAILAAF
ncbi:hypothetical protein L596_024968 [Steinernema carpocapsae]|uniref:Uncharacterized protein n=1 Tax=Steinernema carpocapsae TaxID=34508 RepID=A0A4U5M6E7_STECR|nr:hypothetical protein L596_024968 [Steinernema carpocapsae]